MFVAPSAASSFSWRQHLPGITIHQPSSAAWGHSLTLESFTHMFKVQMLSSQRWRLMFNLPFSFFLQRWCSVTDMAASLATISVSKIQNKKENWGFLLSRGFFKTCKVIRILLWHRCISVYWQKQRTPPAYRWASVVSWKFTQWCNVPFPPSETGQQWEGGWGLHHIISPQRGRPAAYSCLMAPSCHMASQAAATQERQMLWLHKDL